MGEKESNSISFSAPVGYAIRIMRARLFPTRLRVIPFFMLASVLATGRGAAALIAYEPFAYPAGSTLLGNTNGFGFAEPWQSGGFNARIADLAIVKPGALRYPGLLTQGTNHLHIDAVPFTSGISGFTRSLSTNLNAPGAIFYLSFLHQPEGESEYSSVVLGPGTGVELSIGKSGTVPRYHISQRGGGRRVLSDAEPVVGKTVLLVVKLEFLKGNDRFTLFVNPTPGKPEPTGGFVKDDIDLEFAENLTLYSRGAWSVDELRLGTTWEDVTPAEGGVPAAAR